MSAQPTMAFRMEDPRDRTIKIPEEALGFLRRSHLGSTAETLQRVSECLLGLRDIREDDPTRELKVDDAQNAIVESCGELLALRSLLSAEAG